MGLLCHVLLDFATVLLGSGPDPCPHGAASLILQPWKSPVVPKGVPHQAGKEEYTPDAAWTWPFELLGGTGSDHQLQAGC